MDFAQRIAAMRPAYLTRTQERLERLRERLDTCPEGERRAALEEARMLFHDLAGTAPVMGLAELGASARSVEDQVLGMLRSDEPVSEACIAQMSLAVGLLCRELAR